MKQKLITALKVLIFFGVGFGILYWVYLSQSEAYLEDCALKGIPEEECSLWKKVISDFTKVNYFWIAVVCFMFLLSNLIRALRWQLLLNPLGYETRLANGFWCIMLGYFANLGFPRLGEIVRPATFARYEAVPVEKAVGTVAVSRIIDVLFLVLFLGLAVLFEAGNIWSYITDLKASSGTSVENGGPNWTYIILGLGVAILVVGYLFRSRLQHTSIYQKIAKILQGFWQGIKSVGQLERPWLFVGYSVGIWALYFVMNWMAFWAFEPTADLSIRTALTVFVFGSLGIVIPSPGGMGTYHFLVTEALKIYGVSGEDGFSFANVVFFSIQILCSFLFGLIALAVLPIINRNYKPSRSK